MMLTYTCVLVVGLAVRCYCERIQVGGGGIGGGPHGGSGETCGHPCVHGRCDPPFCKCDDGWAGIKCDRRVGGSGGGSLGDSDINFCHCDHGYCKNGVCKCHDGWYGDRCSTKRRQKKRISPAAIGIIVGLVVFILGGTFACIMRRRMDGRRNFRNARSIY